MDAKTSITLKSGATLELQDPGFDIADDLFASFCQELARAKTDIDLKGLDLDPEKGTDLSEISGAMLDSMKNIACTIAGSKALRPPLFAAAARCLYNGQRVTKETFEPMAARPDFLPVAQEVMKFTLAPFFKSLDLKSLLKPNGTPLLG